MANGASQPSSASSGNAYDYVKEVSSKTKKEVDMEFEKFGKHKFG